MLDSVVRSSFAVGIALNDGIDKTFEIAKTHPNITKAVATSAVVGALVSSGTWGYLSGNTAAAAAETAASYRGVWTPVSWATGSLAESELASQSAVIATRIARATAGILATGAAYLGREKIKSAAKIIKEGSTLALGYPVFFGLAIGEEVVALALGEENLQAVKNAPEMAMKTGKDLMKKIKNAPEMAMKTGKDLMKKIKNVPEMAMKTGKATMNGIKNTPEMAKSAATDCFEGAIARLVPSGGIVDL